MSATGDEATGEGAHARAPVELARLEKRATAKHAG